MACKDPFSSDKLIELAPWGSTPTTCVSGDSLFIAIDIPAIKAPPPTGTNKKSSSDGISFNISRVMVPFPSIESSLLKGWKIFFFYSFAYSWAFSQASSKESPSYIIVTYSFP